MPPTHDRRRESSQRIPRHPFARLPCTPLCRPQVRWLLEVHQLSEGSEPLGTHGVLRLRDRCACACACAYGHRPERHGAPFDRRPTRSPGREHTRREHSCLAPRTLLTVSTRRAALAWRVARGGRREAALRGADREVDGGLPSGEQCARMAELPRRGGGLGEHACPQDLRRGRLGRWHAPVRRSRRPSQLHTHPTHPNAPHTPPHQPHARTHTSTLCKALSATSPLLRLCFVPCHRLARAVAVHGQPVVADRQRARCQWCHARARRAARSSAPPMIPQCMLNACSRAQWTQSSRSQGQPMCAWHAPPPITARWAFAPSRGVAALVTAVHASDSFWWRWASA